MLTLWCRLPVLVRCVITGLALAAAGTVPWAVLVALNLKHGSAVPWAVIPAGIYLWFYWGWVRGKGWPRSTAEVRRSLCRARRLPEEVWGMAIVAGVAGLVAMVMLQGVLGRLVVLPQQQSIDPAKYPSVTVLAWVLMGALVAGVVEEASFRGYLQGPIERHHGPVIAILVTGSLFGFVHFTHPETTFALMPFYLTVAAVYGMLAYLTNSILPSLVLHAGGDVLGAFSLFAGGRSEWQLSGPQPLVWETGADAAFWISVALMLLAGAAAAGAYVALARVVRSSAQA